MLASAVLLVRSGIETRGRRLEDIQDLLADSASAPAMQP
jgi:hypothetical protein